MKNPPHRDTELVLASLEEGETVAVTRDGNHYEHRVFVEVGLDGIVLEDLRGNQETVDIITASRPLKGVPADLEIT